jgi:glucose-6-phosphate-specific signal transduction histidine kinase
MPLTETEMPPPKPRWWSSWKSLQTVAFTIGWAAGVPAGALGALAWGIWSNQATYASMEAKYVLVIASNEALSTRLGALEKVNESSNAEMTAIRDRLTKVETEAGPKVITSELLDRYGAHINALDGRSDEIKRSLDTMREALQAQITGLCVEIRGIGASSGRKARSCP